MKAACLQQSLQFQFQFHATLGSAPTVAITLWAATITTALSLIFAASFLCLYATVSSLVLSSQISLELSLLLRPVKQLYLAIKNILQILGVSLLR
jgi:hypothetical protein